MEIKKKYSHHYAHKTTVNSGSELFQQALTLSRSFNTNRHAHTQTQETQVNFQARYEMVKEKKLNSLDWCD